MSRLEEYCRVVGEMHFQVRGPEAVGEETTDQEISAGIFRRATLLIESLGTAVYLQEARYDTREGLSLRFERRD